jgi:peptidyl-prolyl cis-trans isomerase D
MFESVRRNQRIFLGILLLLIIPSFVVVGAWDLVAPGSDANTVAKVGKQKIQYPQWERSHQQTLDQIRQQLGGRVDTSLFDTDATRMGTLEELITQQVLLDTANHFKVIVSDERLRQTIASIPQVQRNGQFDLKLYQQALQAQGLTAEQFEQQVRAELATNIFPAAIVGSVMVPRSVARRLSQASLEQRVVRVKSFSVNENLSLVGVTEAEIKAYYEANSKEFQTAEEMDIAILRLANPPSADAAEEFSNLVYEQADSLDPAAKKFGLTIDRINSVRRTGPSQPIQSMRPEIAKVFSNPKFLDALFSPDAIVDKRNIDALQIDATLVVSARMVSHRPAAAQPLNAVEQQIRRQLVQAKAQEVATNKAKALQVELGANIGVAASVGFSSAQTLSRAGQAQNAGSLPAALKQAIFSADAAKLPATVVLPAGPNSPAAWVAVIDSVAVPSADQAEVRSGLAANFQLLESASAQDQLARWLEIRREDVGVKVFPERLSQNANR